MNDYDAPDFKKIFDSTPGIFLVLLPDAPKFTIMAANQARLKATMSGVDQIGRGLFEIFPDNPDDPNASGVQNLKHSLYQVLKERRPDTMAVQKYDIPNPESESGFEERYWSPVNTPVLDKNENILYIIHQVEDVTEYIRLKQQGNIQQRLTNELHEKVLKTESEVYIRAQEIQKTNLKLQQAHEEMQQLYAKVKELDEIKTQMFANVSHELRTPLTLIMGPVEELLNQGHLTKLQRDNLNLILRNARILLKHVNDLLDVARFESGKMSINFSEFDLGKLVRLTASHFESAMASKSIKLIVKTPDHLKIQADAEKIQRILMNLLSNAMKFCSQNGWVECSLNEDKHSAIITVADNGSGIRPELREVVFERFRQIKGGNARSVGGTGLGLAIVKDFVELHHGSVDISDTLDGGATFTVKLPLLAPAGTSIQKSVEDFQLSQDTSQVEEIPKDENIPEVSPKGKLPLVLVVEDNSDMRDFIGNTLKGEFQVIKAENGLDGLHKLRDLVPDIILTDIMMPQMSGDQMIEEIRKNEDYKDIPIILLTAKLDDELKLKLLGEGCQDFISKPFSQKELLLRVKNLVIMKESKEILSSELSIKSSDILSLTRELTLRKRELQNSLETTKVAKEQAEAANEMKSRLLTTVSHELRTPLTTLLLAVEMIPKKNPTVKESSSYRNILESSLKLKNLIEQLIEYSYIQSGSLIIKEDSFYPQELIESMIEEMDISANEKGIHISCSSNIQEMIIADCRLIKIVLYNLFSNAIKFTDRGNISIKASVKDDHLLLEINDTGAGIADDDLKKIFEPFEQLGPIQNKGLTGIGLGLPFVKGIVDALKGTIEVESERGKGSTFRISLPVKRLKSSFIK